VLVFGETNGEKALCVLLVALSWMVLARQLRRVSQNYGSFSISLGCVAAILYIGYLAVKIEGF
jgi:hypothetical protein